MARVRSYLAVEEGGEMEFVDEVVIVVVAVVVVVVVVVMSVYLFSANFNAKIKSSTASLYCELW